MVWSWKAGCDVGAPGKEPGALTVLLQYTELRFLELGVLWYLTNDGEGNGNPLQYFCL